MGLRELRYKVLDGPLNWCWWRRDYPIGKLQVVPDFRRIPSRESKLNRWNKNVDISATRETLSKAHVLNCWGSPMNFFRSRVNCRGLWIKSNISIKSQDYLQCKLLESYSQWHHGKTDQSVYRNRTKNIRLTTTFHLILMMTSAHVVETSVTTTDNSPSQDYTHPNDQTTLFHLFCYKFDMCSAVVNICNPLTIFSSDLRIPELLKGYH